jgi:hypothetical protein
MNVLRSVVPNQAWLLKGGGVFLSMGCSLIVLALVLAVVLDLHVSTPKASVAMSW